ncbi:fasciclin-like arabinogalactan protein 21 [Phoenix dactylifera]|uniref:Fasciclin-like arabinogalactan protein 21 n=1 Tax=Phoenix dactylifera TaxID=42345 RepID=A0A8B9AQL7_PHODC|nr:fasciclin-like arabinogalactan protein 21 [Phoenix dactylifera]XP_038985624.1 fasciclin-like arabinogalactan protein 21 [Phoenix dactylifera]
MASPSPLSSLLSLVSLSLLLLSSAAFQPSPPSASAAGSGSPPPQEPHQATLLGSILANLGFQELAMAVPALVSSASAAASSSPFTVFAPSDDSIRSCAACSPAALLREHLVPGLFSKIHLSKIAFGTKLETASPGRCLTVTSTSPRPGSNSSSPAAVKIFVDGVEVTRPDLFNDGRIVIHGLQGFVSPLSPLSCLQDHIPYPNSYSPPEIAGNIHRSAIVQLMLRDAMVRLRIRGYSILALAMRIKYAELAGLQNMTVFALDDSAIFAGGHAYVTNVRFHVVPNRLLMHADLLRLPAGTALPTLVHGQHLVVTNSGSAGAAAVGPSGSGLRINYVPIKAPDAVYNSKIVVHGIFLPFPHLYQADMAAARSAAAPPEEGIFEAAAPTRAAFGRRGACGASGASAGCSEMAPSVAPAISAFVDLDDEGL